MGRCGCASVFGRREQIHVIDTIRLIVGHLHSAVVFGVSKPILYLFNQDLHYSILIPLFGAIEGEQPYFASDAM